MEEEYLIHYRTPGSKNGVRLYQYEDGSLTPAGKRRYLENGGRVRKSKSDELPRKLFSRYRKGVKGNIPWVSKEFEEENEYNSRQNEYFKPSKESTVSGSKRSRVSKDQSSLEKKVEALNNDYDYQYDKLSRPTMSYSDRQYAVRQPWQRNREQPHDPFTDLVTKVGGDITKKTWILNKKVYKHVKSYFENSLTKTVTNLLVPPKGSDGINYLTEYIDKESDEALTSYIRATVNTSLGSIISSFIQTSQMNIVSGCARFLDSIGLDDEVNNLFKKLGIKAR